MKKKPATPSACCLPAVAACGAAAAAQTLANTFKALADPARLRLLSLIAGQADGEACVCHLTEPLGLSQPTVSHHLKILREAGLLSAERRGTWVFYRLVKEQISAVRDALALPPQPRGRA